jgi:hypothetical protein
VQRNHEGLRRRLAHALGREVLPRPVWEVLTSAGHVRDFDMEKITEERLTAYARALLVYGDVVEQVGAEVDQERGRSLPEPPRFDYEAARARALSRYLELRVATHPDVLRFRRRWFPGGQPLSAGDALLLAQSPALREAQPEEHGADEGAATAGHLELVVNESGGCARVDFGRGSVLERLKMVSQQIRREMFPPWSEAEAAWVIATGKVRTDPCPVTWNVINHANDYLTYGTINIAVEPWVASETVIKAYQWLQSGTLGRKPRALIERNLRVVEFVMGELKDLVTSDPVEATAPPRTSWRKLMNRWNEANPEDLYEDERHFHRDFYRTAHAVVRPYGRRHLDARVASWMGADPTSEEKRRAPGGGAAAV